MLSFLLTVLFTVIMLTALFSITAGLAFIFRKGVLKGRESGMYYVWFAVIVLALIPIKIGEPQFILLPQKVQPEQAINNAAYKNNIKLSDLIAYGNSSNEFDEFLDIEPNMPAENISNIERGKPSVTLNQKHSWTSLLKFISENKELFISTLFIIWLAGFIFATARIIFNYFRMKKLFCKESYTCHDERINGIFKDCLEIAGLNRHIELRVMKSNFSSPCVCGLINPTVFVNESCVNLNAQKLKYIFIHEMCHIKRYDMIYKVLSIIAAGVHWFNPLTYKVVRIIGEDCELSVDREVMNIFGNDQSDYYMNVILDVAEQKCAVKNNRQTIKIPSASLFFGEEKNIKFLKRRYANMKNITNKKRLIIALSIFTAVIISINTIIMSSCEIIGTAAAAADLPEQPNQTAVDYADSNVYEAALRLYFGLLPDEEITQEQLDEITEIKIVGGITVEGAMTDNINNVSLGNLTPVSFVINGTEFNIIPSIVHKRVFEEYIEKKFIETYPNDESGHAREVDKLNAYYTIKDPDHPDIEPSAREEMFLEYPITKEYPIAVFDTYSSTREYVMILGYFAKAGLLDDSFIQNGTMEAGYLTRLPNLQKVSFVNIRAQKLELLPDTVSIATETIPHLDVSDPAEVLYVSTDGTVINFVSDNDEASQNSSSQPQETPSGVEGPSGYFKAPNYGMNIADDGTEYLEFKNQSLYAALMEYFGLDRWYGNGSYITPDMLSQITSIDVKIKPEYNYIYDNIGLREEFNLDCKYIEYTINGKTLDILPEKFMEGGVIEGIFGDNILEYFDYQENYYITKADLSDNVRKDLYFAIANNAAMRMPVYLDGDGNYFTDYFYGSWSMYLLGFPARYYDKPEYDSADIAYMPNLKEFTLDGISEKK